MNGGNGEFKGETKATFRALHERMDRFENNLDKKIDLIFKKIDGQNSTCSQTRGVFSSELATVKTNIKNLKEDNKASSGKYGGIAGFVGGILGGAIAVWSMFFGIKP